MAIELPWERRQPSWLYQVDMAATAMRENWDAIAPIQIVRDFLKEAVATGHRSSERCSPQPPRLRVERAGGCLT